MQNTWKIEPFGLSVSDEVLEDLRRRLSATRWPDEAPDSGWKFGTNLEYMKGLVDYWLNGYDWRIQESALNAFSQYRVVYGDTRLHFIHQPGNGPDPLPLLMLHGWPGSFYEFHKIIGPLTDPESHGGDPGDAFTVVVPSLPGYGFSHSPNQRRLNIEEMAEVLAGLMSRVLGYDRFFAQGGDWGSFVTTRLGQAHSRNVAGIHLNMVPLAPHPKDRQNPSEAEQAFLKQAGEFLNEESGYQWIQGTKPQTAAYALTDSPAGLAAWITEKFYSWSDCRGDLENSISKDELLTNIMIYWVSGAVNNSFWLYYQLRHHPYRLAQGDRIEVPTAIAAFPGEILRPPREWAARMYNLQQWTAMASGGHFAALEEPEELVRDIRTFFRRFR